MAAFNNTYKENPFCAQKSSKAFTRIPSRAPLHPLNQQKRAKCDEKLVKNPSNVDVVQPKAQPKAQPNAQPVINSLAIYNHKGLAKEPRRNGLKNARNITIEAEFEQDIWCYLLDLEKRFHKIKPNYMTKQSWLSWDMRTVLVDWLVSVAEEFKMCEKTLHLSVNYIDRFLSNISVIREKFQLVGSTAMLIAGKIEEIYPPDLKEWIYLSGEAFDLRQILKMEQMMLKVLEFDVQPPTSYDFVKHLHAKSRIDEKTMYLALYLSELALLEGRDYLKHLPSKLAASSVALARYTLFKDDPWNEKLQETAGYSLKQLSPVVQKQHKTFKSSPFKEQQAIQRKYSKDQYHRVALLKPRVLPLDDLEESYEV